MSVLLKLLNVIVFIQQVISETSVQKFTIPGNYPVTIPADTGETIVSMWGAGGSGTGINFGGATNARMYPGGSGAFVSCTINALPGSTIYLLVGGGGAVGNYGKGSTSSAIGGGGKLYVFICIYILFIYKLLHYIQYIYTRSRYFF
jgi:hypothetical protein